MILQLAAAGGVSIPTTIEAGTTSIYAKPSKAEYNVGTVWTVIPNVGFIANRAGEYRVYYSNVRYSGSSAKARMTINNVEVADSEVSSESTGIPFEKTMDIALAAGDTVRLIGWTRGWICAFCVYFEASDLQDAFDDIITPL